ncbi:MAG: hypothetical protein J7L96_00125 [Bacteroidales bacterium]|nr:hypothetical protein [Bacteroidales bacterium]
MTTNDVFVWDLLDRSPFLRSYLNEIEDKGNLEETVGELIVFYRELEDILDIVPKLVFPAEKSSVISLQSSGEEEVISDKDKVISIKKKEVV